MPSGKKPVSCIPCAKRKVRCDKVQPCCHCKRRRQDTCVYPELSGVSHQLLREHTERIEKLELYIRSLGGNPKLADEIQSPCSPGERKSQESTTINRSYRNESTAASSPLNDEASPARSVSQPVLRTSELLAHGDDVTCVETPMWYSWTGHDCSSSPHHPNTQASKSNHLPTILNQKQSLDSNDAFTPLPASHHLSVLWPIFLKNVHPLVKIFFDWEVAPVIENAHKSVLDLSVEEQTLLNAIRFIATLTLSREECQSILSESKHEFLLHCQRSLESALTEAEYTETTDKRVLQALMLYILAMRDRTRPAAIYPLMGIASRIAERMGLHHDGSMFGLSVVRSEERRRIWWQLQFMELGIARLVGTLSLTVFSNWDTRIPSNLEDGDFYPNLESMPVECRGITSMSPCLWRYIILQMSRESLSKDSSEGLAWMLSPDRSLAVKDAKIDDLEKMLAERFLQHCELLNPLHVHIQIGIRTFILAARSNARQPTLVNAKISEVPPRTRDYLLEICSKSLEYFVMSQTTPSISGLRWDNAMFFQAASCKYFDIAHRAIKFSGQATLTELVVYLILEAHQRYDDHRVVDLWSLIGRVYDVHPDLMTAVSRPEVTFIAHITVAAWQKYDTQLRQRTSDVHGAIAMETPEWIQQLCSNFNLPLADSSAAAEDSTQCFGSDPVQLPVMNFDFDMIDWSSWEALFQGPTDGFAG